MTTILLVSTITTTLLVSTITTMVWIFLHHWFLSKAMLSLPPLTSMSFLTIYFAFIKLVNYLFLLEICGKPPSFFFSYISINYILNAYLSNTVFQDVFGPTLNPLVPATGCNAFSLFILAAIVCFILFVLGFVAKDFPGLVIAEEPEWRDCIYGSNAVVNLAGTPISTRWSSEVNIK